MDPLTQQLMQRQMGQPMQQAPPPPMGGIGAMMGGASQAGAPTPPPTGGPMPPTGGAPPPVPMSQGAPPQGGAPVPATPPNPQAHVPPQMQRFDNAQQLMDSYRNNWTPNPMLQRAAQK